MDITGFSQYTNTIICGICFCFGVVIKSSLDFIPNKYIPLIMAITGIVLNAWINRWQLTPQIILEGVVSALASTGTWELVKNALTD
nr:MAG TPA: holin [Caudoviricetes sp.]